MGDQIIQALSKLRPALEADPETLQAKIQLACAKNLWYTPESCEQAVSYWKTALEPKLLADFVHPYSTQEEPKQIGIVMAGNIPLVGMHDLLCCLLSGNKALVKLSSDDSVLMKYFIELMKKQDVLSDRIELTEKIPTKAEGVIATGSNNSFRYFQHYFKETPNVLRKNRKSFAVLDGSETKEELTALGNDIFHYFGLGCRNVSLVFVPKSMDVTLLIDALEPFKSVGQHNRYANNYTYHKALFLMNQQEHLDNGFLLFKESRELHAPLGCLFYSQYEDESEIQHFLDENANDTQCVVGKNPKWCDVEIGQSQSPKLQDFADGVDTMQFLCEL